MIYEYAVDPKLVGSNSTIFNLLMGYFGLERSRVIARFPKRWEAEVYAAAKQAGITGTALSKVTERLQSAKKDVLVRSGRPYNNQLSSWVDNAMSQNSVRPFRAILAASNPKLEPTILPIDEISDTNPLFEAPTSFEVERSDDGLVHAVWPMFMMAKEISLVDPYFEIFSPKYIGPLANFFTALATNGKEGLILRIHRGYSGVPHDLNILEANSKRLLLGKVPDGFSIEIYEWKEKPNGEDFHDRYMLCDCGGLTIGAGFAAEGRHQKARISLLSLDAAQTVQSRFRIDSEVFSLAQPALQIFHDGTVQSMTTAGN
jgi:hypothetical protein